MLEGQAGPQHHGRGRDREAGKPLAGDLRNSLGPGQVTSRVAWPGISAASGRRTPSGKVLQVSVESSLILVPITQQAPTLWGWEAACAKVMVRAAAGAVESVRRVKGLGPTARRHGRAARSDGHPPSSREPADRLPAWRMVWHVGGDGHGADRSGPPLCCAAEQ